MVRPRRGVAATRQFAMATVASFTAEWLAEGPFITAHTSGSTGTPKEVRLPKADMRASARATNAFFGLGAGSVAALPLSVDYIAGKMMVVRALEGGYRLVELPVSNDIVLPSDIPVVDFMPIVPSQIASLLSKPHYSARIRNLLIGGAAPDTESCRNLCDAGYRAFISYGMTETCSHVALARADDPERIFTAMPGITFACMPDGRLAIEAPHFSFGRLVTNDIVDLLSASRFRWRGRADNVINSGGLKLHPEELEALYAPYLPGMCYYVVGRPDAEWGAAATLVIEGDVDTEAIMNTLRSAIDHRRCPKAIETVDAIPRTTNGKPRRI